MRTTWIKALFVIGGLYDGILGLAFLFWPSQLFRLFDVTPPNHYGYVRFPALILLIFAVMFFQIAAAPVKCRMLIPYGVGLKIAYCGAVFGYKIVQGIPTMWMPWAWADLVFLVLFVMAWRQTGKVR